MLKNGYYEISSKLARNIINRGNGNKLLLDMTLIRHKSWAIKTLVLIKKRNILIPLMECETLEHKPWSKLKVESLDLVKLTNRTIYGSALNN